MSHIFRVTLAIAGVAIFPMLAMAEEAKPPGIVTSMSRSANIPTAGMPTGSEMWALWISLPAGKKIEVGEPTVPSSWMNLDMGLTGRTVSAAEKGKALEDHCVVVADEGQESYTGQEVSIGPGEGFACRFGTGAPYWEENRGTELFSRAQLNVGGPWTPGMGDTVDDYRSASGDAKALRVDAISFRKVETELRAAGMMTATTRVITMPPGSRSVAMDRYPTLRMVTRGELKWGTIPVEVDSSAMPNGMFKLGRFNWVEWTRPQQVVLLNDSQQPAELVEWSVAPVSGTAP
jgi:hypothetical protein